MPCYIWFPSFAGFGVGFIFMNIPPVIGQFMELYGVGYAGLSVLLSALLWSHSLIQVPAGLIVDRFGAFRCMVVFASVGAVSNFMPFLAHTSLALAIVARFILGICTGMIFLSLLKIIGHLAPLDKTAKAQGYYGGAFGMGTILAYFILPHLGPQAWRYSYLAGGVLFLGILLLTFLLPREGLSLPKTEEEKQIGPAAILSMVLRSKNVWALGMVHGWTYGSMNNLGQWLPSMLADCANTPVATWALAAILVLFAGSVSRTVSGYALRYFTRAQMVNGMAFLLAVNFLALGLTANTYLLLALGVSLAIFCGLNYGSVFELGGRALPAVYMATALGTMSTIANICNVGLTVMFGYIRDATGSFSWALIAAGVLAGVLWVLCRARISRLDQGLRVKEGTEI